MDKKTKEALRRNRSIRRSNYPEDFNKRDSRYHD